MVLSVWFNEIESGVPERESDKLQVDGKFFRASGKRVFLKMVTYGPFPEPQPDHLSELVRIKAAGFNALRIYGEPDGDLLDAAKKTNLWLFIGPSWQWGRDFTGDPTLLTEAGLTLEKELKRWGTHPAVAGVFIANEIPSDMIRWMGISKVREALESLIDLARQLCPELLFAYASFPTTEFMEPANADFTAMNVYLEDRQKFAAYLRRLHHVAGDRPVLVSEFGFDSYRGGLTAQAEVLGWSVRECLRAAVAGVTIFSWSDRWQRGGRMVEDWQFGLTDDGCVSGAAKPSLDVVSKELENITAPEDGLAVDAWPFFSVIVCTHNGAQRMDSCLQALAAMNYPNFEVIVVDDGSTDNTADVVAKYADVRFYRTDHVGLSAARNLGAQEARGEIFAYTDDDCMPDAAWLRWLAWEFQQGEWDACGGPNLPPVPESLEDVSEAVVAAAPGAPSHVMLDDTQAEHLPGCNLVVKREAFETIGGFRPQYRVAGDDVDFCWRLEKANLRMGFNGGAFVWHRRRTSMWRYFKQQFGYGKAEALLMADHPGKFRYHGGAQWQGCVYTGGAMSAASGDVIYHGTMGTAPYQQIQLQMQPQRLLAKGFDVFPAHWRLSLAQWAQPQVRKFARWYYGRKARRKLPRPVVSNERVVLADNWVGRINEYDTRWWCEQSLSREHVLDALLDSGWESLEDDAEWDLEQKYSRLIVAREQHQDGCLFLIRIELLDRGKGELPPQFSDLLESLGLHRA